MLGTCRPSILQWEVSVPICCLVRQTRHHQTCCHVPLLYFSPFTKAQQGDVCGAGEGVCKGLLPTEVEKEEKGCGHEVAPPPAQGESWGPWKGRNGSVPHFCLCYFEGPRLQASGFELLGLEAGLGKGGHPSARAQASWNHCCFCCRQLWAAPGQVGAGAATSDP